MGFPNISALMLFAVIIWPCNGGKTALACNHHIVFAVGTVYDEQISTLIPATHDSYMGIARIKYQITRNGLIPGNGDAVSMLGPCATAMAYDVTAAAYIIKYPIHKA